MFNTDYEKLNALQKQVVDQMDKNLLVLAPAGTGKTKVIAMRVARLIYDKVQPEQILCLTFTNKAAKEMKARIELYLPQEGKNILVKTFHSFCYYLICHEKEASHFSFPCTIIDEADSLSIVQKIITQNGLNDDKLFYPQLLSFFENVKRHALTFPVEKRYEWNEVIRSYLQQDSVDFQKSDGFIRKFGLKLFNTYTRYLKENNCIDFMDLVVEAKYLLEQQSICQKWQKYFKVIQVDEMQDTSIREYELIRNLAKEGQLSLFGDFNQTIYEWRGSNPESMIEAYRADYRPEEIKLTLNYRSTQVLLSAANDYIKSSQLYPSLCHATSILEGEKIELLEARNSQQEIQFLVQQVKASQCLPENIAILTRTNGYAKNISDVFMKANIPCSIMEDTKLFRKKEIKELLAFFEYAINERNGHALLKIGEHPYMEMPEWLIRQLRESKSCYMYLHDWFKMDSRDPYSQLVQAYEKNEVVVLDVESTGLSTTTDDIVQIAAICYGKDGIKQELDVLLKPTRSVGDSYFVHGFSDEKLQREGVPPDEALERLHAFVKGKVIVGHNVNYDLQIINSMMGRYHKPLLKGHPVYDTLDLAYKVYPKLPNHKLDTLSELIVTHIKPNHNAMQDILATSEILSHLLEKIMLKKQERLEIIEAYYCYVAEYKKKLLEITQYLVEHTLEESLTFLMNSCMFKQYYDNGQLESIRTLYRVASSLYDEQVSYQDNIINLLTFSALHYSEIEQSDLFKGRIPIITIHQAKGLEFDEVYVAGCNERIFPSYRSIKENHLTEEMRLFYVAMTRAKKKLYLSYHLEAKRSIFLDQIGNQYKVIKNYSE